VFDAFLVFVTSSQNIGSRCCSYKRPLLSGSVYTGRNSFDMLQHWAATSIRHCSQLPSVILWTSPSCLPSAGSSSSSPGLHYGPSWWLEMEGWSPQTILAQNRGGWPAANESRTSDGETARPGQIGMAVTCGNGYVFDMLLKKKKCLWLFVCLQHGLCHIDKVHGTLQSLQHCEPRRLPACFNYFSLLSVTATCNNATICQRMLVIITHYLFELN